MIIGIIPQDRGLQYLIFISADIKQRIETLCIAAQLKIRVTTVAVYFSKGIAETKFSTFIKKTTIVPFIGET
jgi:hypothetical protein